jgi:hypothetical protein
VKAGTNRDSEIALLTGGRPAVTPGALLAERIVRYLLRNAARLQPFQQKLQ